MTLRGKIIFGGGVLGHAILSWFSASYCAGISMVLLDAGKTVAPPSLIAVCWTAFACSLPFAPLTEIVLRRLPSPNTLQPLYWLLALFNSLAAVSIIYFVMRVFQATLLSRQSRLAHEKT
jgi:hypothetical protein